MNVINGPKIGISGRIEQWEVVNKNGSIEQACYKPSSNLITNAGLDLFCTANNTGGVYSWNVAKYIVFGTSETCPNINNPGISILDEEYIPKQPVGTVRLAYTYATWDIDEYSPVGGEDGHYYISRTRGVETVAGDLVGIFTEIGFSPTSTKNSSLFSKFRLVDEDGMPANVPIAADQKLRLRYKVTIELVPITTTTGSFDITGPVIGGTYNYTVGWCKPSFDYIVCLLTSANRVSYNESFWLGNTPFTFLPIGTSYPVIIIPDGTAGSISIPETYVSGSNEIYRNITYNSSSATWPEGIKTITYSFTSGGSSIHRYITYVFDTPIIKLNTHNLSFRIKFSWGRV
jgi:hypothetical protein